MLAFLALLACLSPAVAAQSKDATFDSTVFLLKQAMRVHQDGRQNQLLRSLRHLADPQMTPLLNELAQSDYPVFKIHGLLGLAECSDPRQIDLVRLAAVEDPAVQAELVSAALDSELLTLDQCQQLIDWPGLDVAVKVIVSAPLVKAGRLSKLEPLHEAAKAENLARRSMASLLLLQLGHAQAMDALEKLNISDNPARDQVRDMLLRSMIRYELDKAAPWAMKIADDADTRSQLRMLALSVAMRFNAPGSTNIWQQQFATSTDTAQRTRLALMALRLSPWMQASFYQPLMKDDDPMMVRIGAAGAAVASGKDIPAAVTSLIDMHHPIANSWALNYASNDASPQDARAILHALILAYEQGPARGREQRLDDAATASQLLAEQDIDGATIILRPILANPQTPRQLTQAILLGLIRSSKPLAHQVIMDLPPQEDMNIQSLVLLLTARSGQPLSPQQLADLAINVRGGGLPQDSLRIQAAWLWLKATGQVRPALDQALKP